MNRNYVTACGLALSLLAGCGEPPDEPPAEPPPHPAPDVPLRKSESAAADVGTTATKTRAAASQSTRAPRPHPAIADGSEKPPQSATAELTGTRSDQPDGRTFERVVSPYLTTYCLKCHGPEKQEGDFRVDAHLAASFLKRDVAARWNEVRHALNTGQMPPRGETRPSAADTARVVAWITRESRRAARIRLDGTTVLRRMNRHEYNNTIRDLIGLNLQLVDEFPEDAPAGGFDNNGGALTISPFHLERYLKAARKILDRAIVDESSGPKTIKWHFEIEDGRPGSGRNRVRLDNDKNRNVHLNGSNRPPMNGMMVYRHEAEGSFISYFTLPRAGEYIIRVRAAGAVPAEQAVRSEGPKVDLRRHQENWERGKLTAAQKRKKLEGYDRWSRGSVEAHYKTDRSYRYGPPRLQILGYLGSRRPILDSYDVAAPLSEPRVYETRTLMPAVKSSLHFTNKYHIPFAPWFNPHFIVQRDDFPRPELYIDWIEIEGPVYDAWPPSSHTRILLESPNKGRNEAAYARDVLAGFMRRAFRRPVSDSEVRAYAELFDKARPDKPSFAEAIKVPLAAVLASPHFLYLVEAAPRPGAPGRPRKLDGYQLASRLSYFLWSSMPDETLFGLAASGKLHDPAVLRRQVDRMLKDPRSRSLIKNFAGQWLDLRKIGVNPPIAHRYDRHLELSMRGETEAFFEHILRNDRSVLEFLHSNYLMINERLARFYDIPGVKGDHFRPVPVPADTHRGGLVGQASVLAVTSNGTRTSPVWRGVWILERLLGDPPPPPPPNAGDIPPVPKQQQNRVSLRQRLQLHRRNAQCAGCHNKIDPLGFALENFDHAGGWRERDGTRRDSPLIDAAARLPDGSRFVGVDGLRTELLRRRHRFLRCLAQKLYTYALGRELTPADDATIAAAVGYMNANRRTLRSLMHHIVSSQTFRTK